MGARRERPIGELVEQDLHGEFADPVTRLADRGQARRNVACKGNVIEPEHDIIAIGSGGSFARAAAGLDEPRIIATTSSSVVPLRLWSSAQLSTRGSADMSSRGRRMSDQRAVLAHGCNCGLFKRQ